MAKMLVTLLSVLAVSVVSARQAGSTCELTLTVAELEKKWMACMSHDPSLMLLLVEHMNNPQGMASTCTSFVCQNKKEAADMYMCVVNKLVDCVPGEKDVIKQILPSRQRWEDELQFVCDNKEEFARGLSCLSNELPQIIGCVMAQLGNFNFNNMVDPQAVMCSVARLQEKCFKDNHGSCTQEIVNLYIEAFEKVIPTNNCPPLVVDTKDKKSNPFDSILIHGQPLRYQPQGEVKYGVLQG